MIVVFGVVWVGFVDEIDIMEQKLCDWGILTGRKQVCGRAAEEKEEQMDGWKQKK